MNSMKRWNVTKIRKVTAHSSRRPLTFPEGGAQ
jgi:hypothetical protein